VATTAASKAIAPAASPIKTPLALARRENIPNTNTAINPPSIVPAIVLMMSMTLLPNCGAAKAAMMTSTPSNTVIQRLAQSDRAVPPNQLKNDHGGHAVDTTIHCAHGRREQSGKQQTQ
jgi:hypothetical protein